MTARDKDWGTYFRQIFDEGKVFTEELLRDNERLRQRVAFLENERAQSPTPAPRVLSDGEPLEGVQRERDELRRELSELKTQLARAEQESEEFAKKYVDIERQNSAFASLYVASYQLHSTLNFELLLERINEVVINLVGAEQFAIYLYEPEESAFVVVSGESVEQLQHKHVPLGDNLLTRIARGGKLVVAAPETTSGSEEEPLAAMPLMVADELVGVLVIHKLLMQKDGFEPVDMELFDLLGAHAATAVMAARLYSRSQRKASTLEGFLALLKDPSALSPDAGKG